jgi:uncharacterized protein YrzB (UPF0473 family)
MGSDNGSDNGLSDDLLDLTGDDALTESDIRVLVDSEGNETICVLHRVVDFGGQLYGLLTPIEEYHSEGEHMEVFIFEYLLDQDGNEQFNEVPDDDTFEAVATWCKHLLDDDDEIAEA